MRTGNHLGQQGAAVWRRIGRPTAANLRISRKHLPFKVNSRRRENGLVFPLRPSHLFGRLCPPQLSHPPGEKEKLVTGLSSVVSRKENKVTMEEWDELRRQARTLEADIDHKLIAFNRLSVSWDQVVPGTWNHAPARLSPARLCRLRYPPSACTGRKPLTPRGTNRRVAPRSGTLCCTMGSTCRPHLLPSWTHISSRCLYAAAWHPAFSHLSTPPPLIAAAALRRPLCPCGCFHLLSCCSASDSL